MLTRFFKDGDKRYDMTKLTAHQLQSLELSVDPVLKNRDYYMRYRCITNRIEDIAYFEWKYIT